MIGGFFAALFMGHIYMILIVTAVQIVSFSEVIAIASVPSRERHLYSTKSLNWYWLATTMYFLYGESVIYYFKHIVLVDKVLLPLATHHRFISFVLYVFGMSTIWLPRLLLWPVSLALRARSNSSSPSQASSSLLLPCRPATTSSSSPSSPGPIWRST